MHPPSHGMMFILYYNTMPQTEQINIPVPDAKGAPQLEIQFGAGLLRLGPGDDTQLVAGSAMYAAEPFKPVVTSNGWRVVLGAQHEWDWDKVSAVLRRLSGTPRHWDLRIGTMPLVLVLKLGALKGELELGGLKLQHLKAELGASDLIMRFSKKNQIPMRSFECLVGAARANLYGLANTNTSRLRFGGGAGEYMLDFSGQLQQNMDVLVDSGVGKVTLAVPPKINCRITKEAPLTVVTATETWQRQSERVFVQQRDGLVLNIQISMAVGKLVLTNPHH